MRDRLHDRIAAVRAAAARAVKAIDDGDDSDQEGAVNGSRNLSAALKQLLDTDTSTDVRQAVLSALSKRPQQGSTIIQRLRDTSKDVRCMALSVLFNGDDRAYLDNLQPHERAWVVQNGLSDSADIVRQAATKLLIAWLDLCDDDVYALVDKLDLRGELGVKPARLALHALMDQGRIDPVKWARYALDYEQGLRCTVSDESDQCMTLDEAVTWRVLADRLSDDAKHGSTEAAKKRGIAAAEAAEGADRLYSALEMILPDSVGAIFKHVTASLIGEDAAVGAELLRACVHMDTSDSVVRQELRLQIGFVLSRLEDTQLAEPVADLLLQCCESRGDTIRTAAELAERLSDDELAASLLASTMQRMGGRASGLIEELEALLQRCNGRSTASVRAACLLCLRSLQLRPWAVERALSVLQSTSLPTGTRAEAASTIGDLIACFGKQRVAASVDETSASPLQQLWETVEEDSSAEGSEREAALSALARLVVANQLEGTEASAAVAMLLVTACDEDESNSAREVQACMKALKALALCKRADLCSAVPRALRMCSNISVLVSALASLLQEAPSEAHEEEEASLEGMLECVGEVPRSEEASIAKLAASLPLQFELSASARNAVSRALQRAQSTKGHKALSNLCGRVGEAGKEVQSDEESEASAAD